MKLSLKSLKFPLAVLTVSSSLVMTQTPSLAINLKFETDYWNLQQLDIFFYPNYFSYFQDFGQVNALLNTNPNQNNQVASAENVTNTETTNNYENFDAVATVGQKSGNFLERLFASLTNITIGRTSSHTSNTRRDRLYKKYDVIGLNQTDSSRVFEDIYDFDKKVDPNTAVLVDPSFVRTPAPQTNPVSANNSHPNYNNGSTVRYRYPEGLTFSQVSSTITSGSAPVIFNSPNNFSQQPLKYRSKNPTIYQNPYLKNNNNNTPNPYKFKPQKLPQNGIYQNIQNDQWRQQQLNQQKQFEQQQRQLIQQQKSLIQQRY